MDWVERIFWMYIGVLVVNIFKEVKKWYYEGVQAKDYKRMVKQVLILVIIAFALWYAVSSGLFRGSSFDCENGYDARGCL